MNMKYIIFGVIGLAVLGFLFSEQGSASKPKINLTEVLNRSTLAMDRFDKYLKENKIEKASDQHLDQLNTFIQKVMNTDPRFNEGLIAMRLGKDAKFRKTFWNLPGIGLLCLEPHGSCVSSRKRFKPFSETETQT